MNNLSTRRNATLKSAVAALPMAAAFAMLAMPATRALATTYDADTTAPANDGSGNWNTSTLNWYNGSSDVVWSNGIADTATFGAVSSGTGGTVVVGTVNAGLIQFNPQTTTGYTLSTGTITLGTGITTTSAAANTISAKISGSAGLAFNGVLNATNGVTLSGANDYTGITTLSTGGRLTIANATGLGSSAGASTTLLGSNYTQVNANTTVNISNGTSEAFLINGQGSVASGNPQGALRIAGVTLASLVKLGSASTITSPFAAPTLNGNLDLDTFVASFGNGSNAGTFTINGVVTGTGVGATGGITINNGSGNPNVVNLTNAGNSYTGTTTVNGGTLGLGGDTVLGSSTLNLASGTIQSTNSTARNISGAITGTGTTIFGQTTGQTGALNFNNATAANIGTLAKTFTTNVDTTFANGFTGSAALTKAGAAALIMNGTSAWNGSTTVSAGTLGGTGTLSASAVTVAAAGSITGATNLTTGTLTLGAGATIAGTYVADLSATASDTLAITGVLDLTSTTDVLTLQGVTGLPSYTLATFASVNGSFNTVNGLPSGYQLNYLPTSITLTATPEPASLGVLAMVGGVSLMRRRKSR